MRNFFLTLFGFSILFVALTTSAFADGFKPGLWDITMTTKTENIPPQAAAQIEKMRDQMTTVSPDQKSKIEQLQKRLEVSNLNITNKGKTYSMTKCLTKPLGYLAAPQQEQHCQQNHETFGNTVNFQMSCKGDVWEAEYSGNVTYSGQSMLGQMKSHIVEGDRTLEAIIDITGKYVGPCISKGQ